MARDRGAADDRFLLHRHRAAPLSALAVAPALVALTACGGVQSTLDPAGPSARIAALLWWWMAGYAALVFVAVVVLWLVAARRRTAVAGEPLSRTIGRRWIVGGGVVLPLASIAVLLGVGLPAGERMRPHPVAGAAPLRIDVVARQWAWDVHYPGRGVVLRNELRLPAGVAVDMHVTSHDVIHSFWVPRLAGKIDALPGRVTVLRLHADEPGTMRGQCAEFCGIGHAHMALVVHVMPPGRFAAWLDGGAAQ